MFAFQGNLSNEHVSPESHENEGLIYFYLLNYPVLFHKNNYLW